MNKFYWIWWYPIWFQNKIISLISGWFDSWVSTYLMIKRWCKVDYLFFNLWGNAHELWVKQVAYYLWKNYSVSYEAKFITINFENIIKEIVTKVNNRYRAIVLKRMMIEFSSKFWESWYFAQVLWDSLGQVSSQTLENLNVIDRKASLLTFRPLISFDKQEIIDLTKKIWTFSFASNMPEYCAVVSDNPSTKAKEIDIIKEEEKIDLSLLNDAFEKRKTENIKDVLKDDLEELEKWLEIAFLPAENEVIIDIRESDLIKKSPLIIEKTEKLEIPFFEINNYFLKLDQSKTYLFYCDKWVLSKLHALYLKEKWFNNIKVFRHIKKDKECGIS